MQEAAFVANRTSAGMSVAPALVAVLIVVVFSALGSQAAEQDGAHRLTIQIVAPLTASIVGADAR